MLKKFKWKTHDEWLNLRKNYIGGSDAGAVMGLNPYRSAYNVWAEKCGKVEGFKGNLATRVGTELEDLVAREFCNATGKKVRRNNFLMVNDKYPFACADVDREIVGESALLECKTTANLPKMKMIRGKEVPHEWYCQVQHYLAITGKKKCYLSVLILNNDFKWFEIDRDEEDIKIIMDRERLVYEHIQSGEELDIDGSESTESTLNEIYKQSNDCEEVVADQFVGILQEWSELQEAMERMDVRATEITSIIRSYMKTAEKCLAGDYKITWKPSTRKTFDYRRYIKEHSDIDFTKYYKETNMRLFHIYEPTNKA